MAPLAANDALRLGAEIKNDPGQLARDEVTIRASETDETTTYALALLLSNYYTGAEKLFKRVAVPLGGLPPGSARCHAQLLEDMTLDAPDGTRPAAAAWSATSTAAPAPPPPPPSQPPTPTLPPWSVAPCSSPQPMLEP